MTAFEDGIDFFSLSWGGTLGIVGASVGGSEQSQLYLMDTRTGRIKQITHFDDIQIGTPAWAPDDHYIYYRSNQENKRDFFIYRMDITNGESEKIFGAEDAVSGYNYVADISPDGKHLICGNFSSNVNNDLYLLDLTTLEYQQLTEDTTDVYYGSPTLMEDGQTIWLTCNNNPSGMSRLAKLTVGSPEIEWVDDGWLDTRWDIEGMHFSRDFKYQVARLNEDGYSRLRMREVATGRELPSPPLEGIMGGGYFDRNGTCLISFMSPTRAPDVWRWNPKNSELTQLTFATYAGIDRELFTEPQLIHYESFDGLEIPAFLYVPAGYKKGTPIPFVVDAHGGPEGQSRPWFQRNVQYLLLNGFGLIYPNVRGSEGYGRDYLAMDNYKLRKNSLKDYKAATEWLIDNGYTEKGMIGIRGGSYGGYVSVGMITEYPDLFSAAVDAVGIVNFVTFLENTRAYRRALRESEYGPLTDKEFLRSISPIHKADKIKTPLLVVHGANDPRVPIGEARQIIKAIQRNGGEVDSLIWADEGHGSGKRSNTIEEYRKQVEFFNKYLKKDM